MREGPSEPEPISARIWPRPAPWLCRSGHARHLGSAAAVTSHTSRRKILRERSRMVRRAVVDWSRPVYVTEFVYVSLVQAF